ncbi:hypothetical protein [uncultured Gimesia sp.]|jgi:hypothetical protein|nr:hypothetical protein [uncultured Gimesia sp.]
MVLFSFCIEQGFSTDHDYAVQTYGTLDGATKSAKANQRGCDF